MGFNENELNNPKILVVSNNPFSSTNNNGKTLASFFEGFSPEQISQLYFNSEIPNWLSVDNYFRITDKDIIKSIIFRTISYGDIIKKEHILSDKVITKDDNPARLIEKAKNYESIRLVREILWKLGKWNSIKLENWIADFSPDILFFCAGDSGFAYNISEYIKKKYKCKLVIYITDDYILPRNTLNPFWWIRRNYILNKMRKSVNSADLFMTISQKMSDIYKELFNKNSIVLSNMTVSMRDEYRINTEEDIITLVYTGGLHFKRFITLGLLGDSIRRYNSSTCNRKAVLKIYSNQKPGPSILKVLNKEGASQYCGSLDVNQLKIVLNSCDVPVHVESFEKKCIESTRLSMSTKIPEYLSLGKPILAIGPSNIASMEYLYDAAYCITNPDSIYEDLLKFLTGDETRNRLSQAAKNKYEKYHDKHYLSERFKDYLNELSSGV